MSKGTWDVDVAPALRAQSWPWKGRASTAHTLGRGPGFCPTQNCRGVGGVATVNTDIPPSGACRTTLPAELRLCHRLCSGRTKPGFGGHDGNRRSPGAAAGAGGNQATVAHPGPRSRSPPLPQTPAAWAVLTGQARAENYLRFFLKVQGPVLLQALECSLSAKQICDAQSTSFFLCG